MAKYHIGKSGKPTICKATKRACPLGGADKHFDTKEQAYNYIQTNMENEYGLIQESNEEKFEKLKLQLENDSLTTAESDKIRTEMTKVNKEMQSENNEFMSVEDRLVGINEPDGGATFSLSGESPTSGFCASPYPEHSKVFTKAEDVTPQALAEYVKEVESKGSNVFQEENTYLGLWNDPQDGKIYLDVSKHYESAEEARKDCENHDQIAFFDLNTFNSVEVNPNAKSGQG